MENGSRNQFWQHSWFSEFDFFHHDIENEALFATRVTGSYEGLSQFCCTKIGEHNAGIIEANSHLFSHNS